MSTLRWILLVLGALILFAIYWYDRKRRPTAHRRLLDDAEAAMEAEEYRVGERREPRFDSMQAGMRVEPESKNKPTRVIVKKPPMPKTDVDAVRIEPQLPAFELQSAGADMNVPDRENNPIPAQTPAAPTVASADTPRLRENSPSITTYRPQRSTTITPQRPEPKKKMAEDKLVVLYVVARNPPEMTGEAMTKAFAETDLQYGEMKIFERTVKYSGKDEVLFRVANMVKPGTFELSRLREYRITGLTLFMQIPGPVEGLKAFNTMLFCAQSLADKLGGEVLDARREPLDSQSIGNLRGEIQLFSLQRRQVGMED